MIEKFLLEEHRHAVDVQTLWLMYLTSSTDEGRFLDMDLGATREERDTQLVRTFMLSFVSFVGFL